MSEVASAYVSLLPSARGFGRALESQVGGEVKSSGGRMGALLGGALKKGAATVAVAAGVAVGTALFTGFKRLDAIDQATAKLKGLGNSTKTVDTIMTNALASVKGTAFGLGDAATVAAGAVASGIEPGKALTKNLKLVADAATIAGTPLNEMGAIFNKVAASGKIQGDVIAQLGDKGIPILQLLGKEIGKTPAEVAAMASKGEIGFATFSKAMQAGLGGAALKSGDTFSGAFANMKAALGRFGAGLLTGVFPIVKQVFGGITGLLDQVTAKVGPFVDAFAARIPGAIAAIKGLFTSGANSGALSAAFESIRATVSKLVAGFLLLVPPVKAAFAAFAPTALAAVGVAFAALLGATSALATVFSSVLAPAIAATFGWMANNKETVIAFVGTLAAFKSVTIAVSVASKAWAAAQLLVNAALAANPIGLVVVAIAALVAGLVYAYKNSEKFRTIVNGAFTAIKAVAGPVLTWLGSAVRLTVTAVVGTWNRLKSATASVWNGIRSAVTSAVNAVKAVVSAVFNAIKAVVTGSANAMRGAVTGAMGAIRGAVTGAMGAVRSAVTSAWNAVKSATSAAWHAVVAAITAGVGASVRLVATLPGKVVGALGSLGSLLFNKGAELIQGLINGIQSKIAAVGSAISSVAGKIKGFLPGSPIKEGPLKSWNHGGAGKRLVGTLADGIKKATPEAAKAAKELAKKIADALQKRIDALTDKVKALQDSLKGLKSALGGYDISSALGIAADPSVTAGVKSQLASFRKAIKDAGGDWTTRLSALGKRMLGQTKIIDATNRSIVKETERRDALSESLSSQKQSLEQLRQTMQQFGDSVSANFTPNTFGQSTSTSTPGSGTSPALTALQDQLGAAESHLAQIRASATGDNLAAIAEASKLLPTIAALQQRVATETERASAPIEKTVAGLDLFIQGLKDSTTNAGLMATALSKLSGSLNPEVYKSLATSGDFATAQQLAALSPAALAQVNTLIGANQKATADLAALSTKAVFGVQQQQMQAGIDATTAKLGTANDRLQSLDDRLERKQNQVLAGQAKQTEVIRNQGAAMRDSMRSQSQTLAGLVRAQAGQGRN